MFLVRDGSLGPFASVELRDDAAGSRATVLPARGALVTSLFVGGRERLYLDEATLLDPKANVRGGVPVLFPSPGRLAGDAFSALGASGAMKQHGFARASAFTETGRGDAGAAWLALELRDAPATRAAFPFAFRLGLRFSLRGAALTIRADVENTGDRPLPFALGYHPYFAVPAADKARARVPTAATRAWDNVAKREVPLGPIALGEGEVDLHLLDHGSSGATLELPGGAVELAGHLPRWVIWTLPGKDFVCVEPWSAPADALNTGEGRVDLAPGATRSFELTITARV